MYGAGSDHPPQGQTKQQIHEHDLAAQCLDEQKPPPSSRRKMQVTNGSTPRLSPLSKRRLSVLVAVSGRMAVSVTFQVGS